MLMREDLGLLLLGAREAIYAVDAHDISVKKAAVRILLEWKLQHSDLVAAIFFFFAIKCLLNSVYLTNEV